MGGENALPVEALTASLMFYFQSFLELHSSRIMDGQIPWTAVNDYGQRYNLDELEFEDFRYMIREIDDEWRDIQVEKRKAEEARNRQPKRPGRR